MTRHEIASLAIKILAMWAFAEAAVLGSGVILMIIISISGFFTGSTSKWQDLTGAAVTGVPAIGELIVGVIFWRFASRFASRIVSDDPTPVTRPDLTQESFLSIAFVAIGVWHLLPALQSFASTFIGMARGEYHFADYWRDPAWQARFWSNILRFGLSMWLIFGSLGLARLVLRLRRPDIIAEEPTEAR